MTGNGGPVGGRARRWTLVVLAAVVVVAGIARGGTENVLVNGAGEAGDLSGWTSVEGDFGVFDRADKGWPGGVVGRRYFGGGYAVRSVMEQTVEVPAHAVGGQAQLSLFLRGGAKDHAQAVLELLKDDGKTVVAAVESVRVVPKVWTPDRVSLDVPEGVTHARVRLVAVRASGKFNDAYFDGVVLALRPTLDQVRDPRTGKRLDELELTALVSLARGSGDDYTVAATAVAIARFREKGFAALASLVHFLVRQERVEAALEVVRILGDGDDAERRAILNKLRNAVGNPRVKAAAARAVLGGSTGTHRGLLANGGAETVGLRGWEKIEGAFRSFSSAKGGYPGPVEGERYFDGGNAPRSVLQQTVAVPPDTVGGVAVFGCTLNAPSVDRISATFETLDSAEKVIESDGTPVLVKTAGWTSFEYTLAVTEQVKFLRVRLIATRKRGKHLAGYADALDLSIRPPLDQLTDAESGERFQELPVTALERLARANGDDYLALSAARVLATREGPGYQALAKVVRHRLREDRPEMAVSTIEILGDGPQDGRRKKLRTLLNSVRDDDVKDAVILALAGFYPTEASVVLKRLYAKKGDARDLLHKLDGMGIFDEDVLLCLDDPVLARDAYLILRRRGTRVAAERLGEVAGGYADEAIPVSRWREILGDWAGRQDWDLALALADGLDDQDEDRRLGAYLLLIGITGDAIAPDAVLWRSRLEAIRGQPTPPPASSAGHVEAAVLRGVRYLKGRLAEHARVDDRRGHWDGATALAILALRSAGVDRKDPVLLKALEKSVLVNVDTTGTYQVACIAMALAKMDPKAHRSHLEAIRDRLVRGQHKVGGWTYTCYPESYEGKWRRLDMSCTQYALLGLRALRKAKVDVPRETWERALGRVRARQSKKHGAWVYHHGFGYSFTMTSAGVGSLAICLEALHGMEASAKIAADPAVRRGLAYLGEYMFTSKGYRNASLYGHYGIERASILTGTRTFGGVDWYRRGVEDLVASQGDSGAWQDGAAFPLRTSGFGADMETAWALLFLKRATTPIDGTTGKGAVEMPGKGLQAFSADPVDAESSPFVRTWRYSDRTRPWIDAAELPQMTPQFLRLAVESAKQGFPVTSKDDVCNLNHLHGGRVATTSAYAYRRLVCEKPTRVKILYGCDDSMRLFVGGKLVSTTLRNGGVEVDKYTVQVDLPAGETDLVVECFQWTGKWGFVLRFESEDGKKLRLGIDGRLTEFVPPEPPAEDPKKGPEKDPEKK